MLGKYKGFRIQSLSFFDQFASQKSHQFSRCQLITSFFCILTPHPDPMDIELELDQQLEAATTDVEKVDAIIEYCLNELDEHKSTKYSSRVDQGLELLKSIDYPRGEAYMQAAQAYRFWGEFNLREMLKSAELALELFKNLDQIEYRGVLTALVVNTFGKLASGDFDRAFENAIQAVKTAEQAELTSSTGWASYTMGIMYFDIRDFKNSLKYYQDALDNFLELQHPFGTSRTKAAVGTCYLELGDYATAKKLIDEVVEEFTENYNGEGLSRAINDLGVLYRKTGDLEKAEVELNKALDIRRELKNKRALTTTLHELGELYLQTDRPEKALEVLTESLERATTSEAKPREMRAQHLLYKTHKTLGNIEAAFNALEAYISLKEDVSSTETNHRLRMQESNFAADKAEQIAQIEREKNIQLKAAHDEIAEKSREITDSIIYAKRIQKAILPNDKLVSNLLPENFVLYLPKDIVAGDFYWLEKTEDKVLFASADCTGHGVPGAMVSVICNNALNRSVREFGLTDPGKILDKTREIVIAEFEKAEEDVKDGMDIALCSLSVAEPAEVSDPFTNSGTYTLQYAGAHNPLWIIRNGSDEVEEIKANKQPIGQFDKLTPFETHTIDLQTGDTFYIFSDGFADQFGGDKGKKFKASNFKKLLQAYVEEDMSRQKELILHTFQEWKGNYEQLDDVCVIGVRI